MSEVKKPPSCQDCRLCQMVTSGEAKDRISRLLGNRITGIPPVHRAGGSMVLNMYYEAQHNWRVSTLQMLANFADGLDVCPGPINTPSVAVPNPAYEVAANRPGIRGLINKALLTLNGVPKSLEMPNDFERCQNSQAVAIIESGLIADYS